MSPMGPENSSTGLSFPRVSGDEPLVQVMETLPTRFSPRERG